MSDVLVHMLLARSACIVMYNAAEQPAITSSYRYLLNQKPENNSKLSGIKIA